MGNASSKPATHNLYILKVSNPDLPLCPFQHTITHYNDIPIADTDPMVLKQILVHSDLRLAVTDLLGKSSFQITIPAGTSALGMNVTRLPMPPSLLNIRVTNADENSQLNMGDQIIGLENIFIPTETDLITQIKSHIGETVRLVILRDNMVVVEEVECKEYMGCELGFGLFYKPKQAEYYTVGYNGKIKREPLGPDGANPEEETPNPPAEEVDRGTVPADEEANIETAEGAAVPAMDRAQDASAPGLAHSLEQLPPDIEDAPAVPSVPDASQASVSSRHTIHPDEREGLRTNAHGMPGAHMSSFNPGIPHGDNNQAAVLAGRDLLGIESFVEKDGRVAMKEDVFKKRVDELGGHIKAADAKGVLGIQGTDVDGAKNEINQISNEEGHHEAVHDALSESAIPEGGSNIDNSIQEEGGQKTSPSKPNWFSTLLTEESNESDALPFAAESMKKHPLGIEFEGSDEEVFGEKK